MDNVSVYGNQCCFYQDNGYTCVNQHTIGSCRIDKYKSDIDPTWESVVEGGGTSVCRKSALVLLLPLELDCSSADIRINKFVVDMWGVNLHHEDNKIFSCISKKFFDEISSNLLRLFSGMLRDKRILASGKVVCNCDWRDISDELLPIAIGSLESILEEQYRKLYKFLSEARIVDIDGSDVLSYVVRAITRDEINSVMERAKEFTCRRLVNAVILSWGNVTKTSKCDGVYVGNDEWCMVGNFGVSLRCSDGVAIFNSRRKFLFEVRSVICNKFSEIMKDKYGSDSGVVTSVLPWIRQYKKLLPIARAEVKSFLENERDKVKGILSKARVVVDCMVDREITNKEKYIVLKENDKTINIKLEKLFANVWDGLDFPLRYDSSDIGNNVSDAGCKLRVIEEVNSCGNLSIKLCGRGICYNDDNLIYDIKERILFDINKRIRNIFSEVLDNKDKSGRFGIVNKSPWNDVSRELLPIVKKEIIPIIERGCAKINEVLLKSKAVFYKPDGVNITRDFKSEERGIILKDITRSIHRKVNFGKLWGMVIKSPKCSGENVSGAMSVCGVNLHPCDGKIISLVRRKFSVRIRVYLRKLFSDMLKDNFVLPSGRVLRDYSWSLFSDELIPIARKSIDEIMEEQYKELGIVLSRAHVLDVFRGSPSTCVIERKITDDEKDTIMAHAKASIGIRLHDSIRELWLSVARYSVLVRKEINAGGVNVRREDSAAILSTRKKFSCKIKASVRDKFIEMIRDKHKFVDGTVIGSSSWRRVSKEIMPIIMGEVKHLLEDESRELKRIISGARMEVAPMVNRELTNEEVNIALKKIDKLMDKSFKELCRRVWNETLEFLRNNSDDATCFLETASTSAGIDEVDKCDSVFRLYREDDSIICGIRRRYNTIANKRIVSKFCEMIKNRHEFDDGTIVGVEHSWAKISRNVSPIVKEDLNSIIEMERMEINEALLKSRAIFLGSDGTSIVRKLTSKESSVALVAIMKSVCELKNVGKLWDRAKSLVCGSSGGDSYMLEGVTESELSEYSEEFPLPAEFVNLREEDKVELGNIRLEFVGNLRPLIDETVSYLYTDVGVLSSRLEYVILVVSEKSYNLFKEGGFFGRVESLLLGAKVVDSSGSDRFITDKESKSIFRVFMDEVASDRDHLVRKRAQEFDRNLCLPAAGVSTMVRGKYKNRFRKKRSSK